MSNLPTAPENPAGEVGKGNTLTETGSLVMVAFTLAKESKKIVKYALRFSDRC